MTEIIVCVACAAQGKHRVFKTEDGLLRHWLTKMREELDPPKTGEGA